MDTNSQGQDGNAANGEMIWKTVKEKEKEKERAMHDAATEGRRKRRKSRHCQSLSSSEEDDEEEAGRRTREPIDIIRMNNGADDPDANKDGYDGDGDGDDDGVAMFVNGTEVARRDVDATSK